LIASEFAFAKRAVCLAVVVVDLVHQEVNQFAALAEQSSRGLERHSHEVECLQHLGAFANSSIMGILAIQFLIQSVAGSLVICGAFEIFPHDASALVHHGEFSCSSNELHLALKASGPSHCRISSDPTSNFLHDLNSPSSRQSNTPLKQCKDELLRVQIRGDMKNDMELLCCK